MIDWILGLPWGWILFGLFTVAVIIMGWAVSTLDIDDDDDDDDPNNTAATFAALMAMS